MEKEKREQELRTIVTEMTELQALKAVLTKKLDGELKVQATPHPEKKPL